MIAWFAFTYSEIDENDGHGFEGSLHFNSQSNVRYGSSFAINQTELLFTCLDHDVWSVSLSSVNISSKSPIE